jgi:hypothetical protein
MTLSVSGPALRTGNFGTGIWTPKFRDRKYGLRNCGPVMGWLRGGKAVSLLWEGSTAYMELNNNIYIYEHDWGGFTRVGERGVGRIKGIETGYSLLIS